MTTTTTTKSHDLTTGINGSGATVWVLFTTWIGVDGREKTQMNKFTTETEAQNWIKWS